MTLVRPYEMVRGRCPRDWMRWVINEGGRAVGNVSKTGHAKRLRLPHPGSHATAGRRGRRPLRLGARHTLRDVMQVVCLPRASQMCAGGARGIANVGRWTEAGAPWVTRVPSVTLAIRANVAPAVTQPWCTEDGAPYGQQRIERCGTQRNVYGKSYPNCPPTSRLR